MLTETQIIAHVREYLAREFLYMRPSFRIGDDDDLIATGVIDSMGVLELILFLEESLHIVVADDEINSQNLGSLRAIARFVTAANRAVA